VFTGEGAAVAGPGDLPVDKIIHGFDAPIFHPRWALRALMNFAIPEDLLDHLRHQPVQCREAEPERPAPPYRRRLRRGRFWISQGSAAARVS
jgi:hypothetical protein